ncbi:TIGR03619 family F420-dependent LLM class oxidoreductase [Mycolicibacterium monacense]|uniref:LLM class F420-dependent oxidoreductase n=3 Tax=Mycobacteriaceae TaxID=1762 RepID=A0AAD1J172_MYCMB|nr:TIGR03619 family F420-dependent LLM class oxidoreductase [Mycolicibacterium monacense]MDA4102515.1 luciferase [Mycolicibacterium monacense DSM 44395]ORB17925.1 LLM class F420-dependent oxidoreductase [Mycolicibacterium monacense DSM 44395]QHP88639.1 TIGR03619 family F420-dependent LLM class oxidoreductase [Mycolicibacterium monacense DSM 44395]BBZ63928.1 LLM class F420-dependent oxidoreductase [Mycolicibacterium monacense]
MDIGFVSLNTPHDLAPGVLAKELEQRGFESLWLGEHPQIPVSAAGAMPAALLHSQQRMWDPLLSLLVAAQATSTLRLGTAVALPLEHELFTFAKQVATLDRFSGGRVLLGVGVGVRAELAMTNSIAWADRYRALSDMVAALRVLWTEDEACHHGEFYDFDPVWSHPKPQQQPGPPLLAAATGPKAIGECLSWADGWLPGDAAYRDLSAAVHDFRVRAEDAGRDPATLDLTVMAWGDPSANRLARYRDLGFTRVVVGGGRRDGDDPSTTLPFLDRYAALVSELR